MNVYVEHQDITYRLSPMIQMRVEMKHILMALLADKQEPNAEIDIHYTKKLEVAGKECF